MKAPFFVYYSLVKKSNLYETSLSDLQCLTFSFKLDFHLYVALSIPVFWVVLNKGQMHANIKVQIILF